MEQPALPLRRLTWLVGPPGAGKSTFAARQECFSRVVELTDMLAPLVDRERIRAGVLTANGQLVHLIRQLELRPENLERPPLLVVAGLVPEGALFPLGEHETVWLLRPPEERWQRQLRGRPVGSDSSRQYDDYDYSERWHARFEGWRAHDGVHELRIPFDARLLGRVAERLPSKR